MGIVASTVWEECDRCGADVVAVPFTELPLPALGVPREQLEVVCQGCGQHRVIRLDQAPKGEG